MECAKFKIQAEGVFDMTWMFKCGSSRSKCRPLEQSGCSFENQVLISVMPLAFLLILVKSSKSARDALPYI